MTLLLLITTELNEVKETIAWILSSFVFFFWVVKETSTNPGLGFNLWPLQSLWGSVHNPRVLHQKYHERHRDVSIIAMALPLLMSKRSLGRLVSAPSSSLHGKGWKRESVATRFEDSKDLKKRRLKFKCLPFLESHLSYLSWKCQGG